MKLKYKIEGQGQSSPKNTDLNSAKVHLNMGGPMLWAMLYTNHIHVSH